jgi:sugar phosphate isomerase/epimerase
MIKLGVNSVLFQAFDFPTAVKHIAAAGYDGVEISAIKNMCEHLVLDSWRKQAGELKSIVSDAGLEFLSMEEAHRERLHEAFEAAAEIGIPVVNVGPGGSSDNEAELQEQIEVLGRAAEEAESYGVALCVKAHVGQAIYSTPTTLRATEAIPCPAFGIDMDPSHIHRAGEDPKVALSQVLQRVRHIHIRDCLGRDRGPGTPQMQACGRGDIDLWGYCRAMVEGSYSGPVCLEVIGGGELSLAEASIIAAESYGYLNACLKSLGAR